MELRDMQKEVFKVVKSNVDTYIQTQQMLQEQGAKLLDTWVAQGEAVEAESRALAKTWSENAKKASAEYVRLLQETLAKNLEFLSGNGGRP